MGRAAVTGSNWREKNAEAAGGGACTASSAAARFDTHIMRVCVIRLDPEGPAHVHAAGPVLCEGPGAPFSMPKHLEGVSFTEVAVGSSHVCALRAGELVAERRAACWGTADADRLGVIFYDIVNSVPDLGLHSVCSGSYYACGLVIGGQPGQVADSVQCWGESETVAAVHAAVGGRPLQQLACGDFAACAILGDSGQVPHPFAPGLLCDVVCPRRATHAQLHFLLSFSFCPVLLPCPLAMRTERSCAHTRLPSETQGGCTEAAVRLYMIRWQVCARA
jgi:hypothetical protein